MPTKTTPSVSGEAFGLPSDAVLKKLKISREVGWYMASRGIPLPDCPPLIKTPEPSWVKGAVFDPERVDKVLKAFGNLRHTQAELAGQPLNPDPWQIAYIIAPVFGWVKKDDNGHYCRIIRNVTVDIPRKNGKTTLCGGFAMYLTAADGEAGAQVLAAATTRDQARMVFDPIKTLAERAPALRGHVKALQTRIIHPRTSSYFAVVSSAGDAQHGANVHGAVVDELHLHKKPDLLDAIETGTGSRRQPLIFKITTADDGKPNSVYSRNRHYIEQLARGVFKDSTTYGVIFAVPRDTKDLFSEATQRAANPGYGVSPKAEFLKAEANKARNSPAQLANYKRLYLGIRTKQTTAYIDLEDWRKNTGEPIDETEYAGRLAYGGLDLSSVSDLTSLCWLLPFEDEHGKGYDVVWRYWTPEDNLDALDKRTAGSASKLWVPQGWLIATPGNVVDYDFIREQIFADAELFQVASIGFDRWNSSHLVNELTDEGINVVKVGQGYMTMSPALKEVQRLTKLGTKVRPALHHGGNPVSLWNIDNLAVAMDPSGNVKPDKANSADKIDGVAALCDAMSEALAAPIPKTSAYELGGVRAV